MDINEILDNLGLDFTNPETRRGALEAIEAILQSRQPSMPFDMATGETDIEIDPDLIQPSKKGQQSQGSDDDVEIDDEEDLLNQIKHNESEDEQDAGNFSTGDSQSEQQNKGDTTDSDESKDTESDASQNELVANDGSESEEVDSDDGEDSNESSDGGSGEVSDDGEDSNTESAESNDETAKSDSTSDENTDSEEDSEEEYDDDDLLDDEIKGKYDDENITAKDNSRKIKRERTLAAAKKALDGAKAKKVHPALIRELESAIAALEELTEAVKKNIRDISDEEFNMLINRVFDAIQAVGDSSLTFSSDEEREIRAQEIKTDMSSATTQAELSAEDIAKIRAETQEVKAREKETAKYQQRSRSSFKGFQDFLTSLYRAIALQVSNEESNDDSWSAINRRYSGTGVLQPGKKLNELPNKKIPVIDFYFDQSGSWTERDIEVGKKAVAKLADMEADGQIKVNIYYFANDVHSDAESARMEGGTGGWNEIVSNIIKTKATNVVIMTDDDMENWWHGDKALTYTVPGYVWYLWRNGENAPRLPRDLKGRGGVQQFSFNRGDI